MERILGLLLVLTLSGCSLLGSSSWDQVKVAFSGADKGDYTLVVTPKQAIYTIDGKATSEDLPEGAWTAVATGVAALRARTSKECDGQRLKIQALSGGDVLQTFEATSCDGGEALEQAKGVLDQLIAQLR